MIPVGLASGYPETTVVRSFNELLADDRIELVVV
jgi:predicted dehydrogenase